MTETEHRDLWKFHHLTGRGGLSEWTLEGETGHLSSVFRIESRNPLRVPREFTIVETVFDEEGEVVSRTDRGVFGDLTDAKSQAEYLSSITRRQS